MDDEQFQQMEKRLNEQVEATQAMNETLNKFLAVMANQEVARKHCTPSPGLTATCNHPSKGVAPLQS
jgi:hypothetical protein